VGEGDLAPGPPTHQRAASDLRLAQRLQDLRRLLVEAAARHLGSILPPAGQGEPVEGRPHAVFGLEQPGRHLRDPAIDVATEHVASRRSDPEVVVRVGGDQLEQQRTRDRRLQPSLPHRRQEPRPAGGVHRVHEGLHLPGLEGLQADHARSTWQVQRRDLGADAGGEDRAAGASQDRGDRPQAGLDALRPPANRHLVQAVEQQEQPAAGQQVVHRRASSRIEPHPLSEERAEAPGAGQLAQTDPDREGAPPGVLPVAAGQPGREPAAGVGPARARLAGDHEHGGIPSLEPAPHQPVQRRRRPAPIGLAGRVDVGLARAAEVLDQGFGPSPEIHRSGDQLLLRHEVDRAGSPRPPHLLEGREGRHDQPLVQP